MRKQFILGVGCQKGGTSWLHSQLKKNQQVDMGFTKEYHIFDALHLEGCKYIMHEKLDLLKKLINSNTLLTTQGNLLRHLDFYRDINNYFDYFDNLWSQSDAITTVGDISPPYCELPVEIFLQIKNELERRGFTVKVIFLMRDPVERCWSWVRHWQRDLIKNDPSLTMQSQHESLAEIYNSPYCELRTRYENTLRNIEAVFPQENVFYALYENLFEHGTLSRLRSFLEIEDFEPNVGEKRNVSLQKNCQISPELSKQIVTYYRETYEVCMSRFNLEGLWPSVQYL